MSQEAVNELRPKRLSAVRVVPASQKEHFPHILKWAEAKEYIDSA